ncbi:MAG: thiamine pyrophosphate-dependent enzyme, partial [Candidatus Adiutrix sp.]
NVAADPLFTMAYIGSHGGLVVISADDPGCHSSQNEQDNRLYAPFAKLLMLEPSDSQECLDFTKIAFELSERVDVVVLIRVTTRVCHSKSLVEVGLFSQSPPKPYVRNLSKTAMIPFFARQRHKALEEKLVAIEEYANDCPLNEIERNQDKKIGVITSGVCYLHAQEAFGSGVSYLKLGLSHPLPRKLIADFCQSVETIYVIEENEPYLENAVKALGFTCHGKDRLPILGELDAAILRQAFLNDNGPQLFHTEITVPPRPPLLCAACPHRGVFHVLGKKKKEVVVAGDIGCYALGLQSPLDGLDTIICMGAGFSAAIGLSVALKKAQDPRKVFGVLGDSTFFHSGLTGLVDAIHADANVCLCVLDNSITAMTGHQENPGTSVDLMNKPAQALDIVSIIKGMGVSDERLTVLDPLNMAEMTNAVTKAIKTEGFSVIVTKRPCILIKEVRKTLEGRLCQVDAAACKKCKQCLKVGCPAISFEDDHSNINPDICLGCEYCLQVCKFDAISRV